jgi:hypothetical protein
LRRLGLLITGDGVLHRYLERTFRAAHLDRLQLNAVAEILLKGGLQSKLQSRRELGAVRLENHLQQTTSESGAIHAFTGIREKQLLDQVANVAIVTRVSRAAASVDLEREFDVHSSLTSPSLWAASPQ